MAFLLAAFIVYLILKGRINVYIGLLGTPSATPSDTPSPTYDPNAPFSPVDNDPWLNGTDQ